MVRERERERWRLALLKNGADAMNIEEYSHSMISPVLAKRPQYFTGRRIYDGE